MKSFYSTKSILFVLIPFILFSSSFITSAQNWRHNGPWSIDVTAIEVHPENDSLLFCGTMARGIWKSIDNGESWVECLEGLPLRIDTTDFSPYMESWWEGDYEEIKFIKVHPDSPHTVWAGTQRGLYFSEDNGSSWMESSNGLPQDADFSSFLICPDSTNILFIGSFNHDIPGGGLYKSVNSGLGWERVSSLDSSETVVIYSLASDPSNPEKLYAGYSGNEGALNFGLKNSSDRGITWVHTDSSNSFHSICVDPADGNHIWSAVTDGWTEMQMVESNDGGYTWGHENCPLNGGIIDVYADQSYNLLASSMDTIPLYFSSDAGATWNSVANEFPTYHARRHTQITSNNDDSAYYFGTIWTLARTRPELDTFEHIVTNADNSYIDVMEATDENPSTLYAGEWGLWRSFDDGDSWEPILYERIYDVAIHPNHQDTLIAGGDSLKISYDQGTTWRDIRGSVIGGVTALAYDPFNPDIVLCATTYYSSKFLYRSTNGGISWDLILEFPSHMINSIKYDEENQDKVFFINFDLWESNDSGLNWSRVGLGGGNYNYYSIALQPTTDRVVVKRNDALFISDENGANFVATENLPSSYITSCNYNPLFPYQLILTTSDGVFLSDDNGNSWAHLDGPYNRRTTCLTWSCDNSTIHIGTHGYGVWSADTDILEVKATSGKGCLPGSSFILYSPHPNPTNGEAIIQIENRVAGVYSLSVFNILGQKVHTLYNGHLEAGFHKWSWNSSNLTSGNASSGAFFIRLSNQEESQVQRVILLK